MNIPDSVVGAAQDKLSSFGWRIPYGDVRQALEAATRPLLAEVWEEGYQDGLIDGNDAIAGRIERGSSKRIPNPYEVTP